MDPLTREQRHKAMSHVHSKDTTIEIKLRKALWHKGYRYRKNYKALPGTPDIAITKYKIAVFCDSEFFHGKDWYEIQRPKIRRGSNPAFWASKIERNIKHDTDINRMLTSLGWTVIRFWGKEITKDVDNCVSVIEECAFQLKINSWNDAHQEEYIIE